MTEPTLPDASIDQGQTDFNNSGGTVEQTSEETPQRAIYADYVEKFPASLHPIAEQVFKEWDGNVTKRFQEVHSQYEPLKPWQQFQDNGISPDQAVQGLILLQRLQQDPQAVYNEIAKAFGFGQQGQQEQQPEEEDLFGETPDITKNPQFAQMSQMTQAIAEYLVQQDTEKRQAAADAAVDAELTALKQKHGDFDERFVVTQMLNGMSGEQAVKAFQDTVNQAIAARQRPKPPTVMRAGGGIPSSQVNVGKLGRKDTMSLVQQMLAQGAQEP